MIVTLNLTPCAQPSAVALSLINMEEVIVKGDNYCPFCLIPDEYQKNIFNLTKHLTANLYRTVLRLVFHHIHVLLHLNFLQAFFFRSIK